MRQIMPFLLFSLLLACCGGPTASEEGVAEAACAALRTGDWSAFQRLTVTTADFIMREQKVKPLERKLSYAGSRLKPAETEKLRVQFERALAGGPGKVDFGKAEFIGLALVSEGSMPTLEGPDISFRVLSLKVRDGGRLLEGADLFPLLVLVRWGGGYRILALRFGEAEE